jgi:hypothetical protein
MPTILSERRHFTVDNYCRHNLMSAEHFRVAFHSNHRRQDQENPPDTASQSQAGMAGASDMRVKLTCVNDSRRFRAQHYVLGREAAGLFPSGSVFEEGTAQ